VCFTQNPALPPSPAEIILFSNLWDLASTSTSDDRSTLSSWLSRITGTEWAKVGIEQATTHTADRLVTKSTGKGAGKGAGKRAVKSTSIPVDDTPREMIQKIKEGTRMKVRDPGESM